MARSRNNQPVPRLSAWTGRSLLVALLAAGCYHSKPSARSEETGPDAGEPAEDAGSGPSTPAQHDSCTRSLPESLPAEPVIARRANGAPRYDDWKSLACDATKRALTDCSDLVRCPAG